MLKIEKPNEFLLQVYQFSTDVKSCYGFFYTGRIERRINKLTNEEVVDLYIKDNSEDEFSYTDFKSFEEAEKFLNDYLRSENQ